MNLIKQTWIMGSVILGQGPLARTNGNIDDHRWRKENTESARLAPATCNKLKKKKVLL